MACINRNDVQFKNIQQRYNASADVLELALKIWLDTNNKEDFIEVSDSYLNNYFKVGDSHSFFDNQEDVNKAHELWDKYKSTTLPTIKKATVLANNLGDIFGKENVISFKNLDNTYTVNVAEPILSNTTLSEEDIPVEDTTNSTVENIISNSKELTLTDDGKFYQDTEGTKYIRVTSLIASDEITGERFSNDSPWALPSSNIGTSIDEFVRDFFSGNTKNNYPNVSEESYIQFKEQLVNFKKSLDNLGITIIPRDIIVTGKYTITDKDGNQRTVNVAGTLDLLGYDKDGNFYVYDMKSHRAINLISDKKKLQKYSKQLSLYKSFLEEEYNIPVKEIKIIPIKVDYNTPVNAYDRYGEGNTIYEIEEGNTLIYSEQGSDDWYYVDSSPTLEEMIELTQEEVNASFENLTQEEKDLISEEVGEVPLDITPIEIAEDNKEINSLFDNTILSASERTYLGNQIMSTTSYIISHLQSSEEANNHYFGDTFKGTDFTSMERTAIIKKVGLGRIFNYIKEERFNPDNRLDIEDFNIMDKLEFAYNNFNALARNSYSKLISLEGVTVLDTQEVMLDEQQETIDENDVGTLEEREQEHWQIGFRQISAKSGLSSDIRRAFEKLKQVDQEGNTIKDKYGYGFDEYIDSNAAVNSILDWVKEATTIEEMETILSEFAPSNPWVNAIIGTLNELGIREGGLIQSEPFRSQFYQNFRKDFSKYSIISVEYDDQGNRKYVNTIINTKGASATILDEIKSAFREGVLTNVVISKGDIEGKGKVNVNKITSIKEVRDKILKDLNNSFYNKRAFRSTLNSSINPLTEVLRDLGINIDSVTLNSALARDFNNNNFANTKVNKILNELGYMLDKILSNTNRTDYNPMSREDDGVYSNYKSIVDIVAPYIQDSIESSTYENGKMYYSFNVPSYMGKLIRNLKDSIGNETKFREFLFNEYGSYKWFKDGDEWNNEWLRLLDTSNTYRQILDHKVQLNFDKTGYTDLSELAYTQSLLEEFFYDKTKKNAWYRVPILSDKPSSEFIRFRRYSSKDYKSQLTNNLFKVFNQELMRIKSVIERVGNDNISKINNFDISDKVLNKYNIKDKVIKGNPLTFEEFNALDGGSKFKFLEAFNSNLSNKDALGTLILDKINGNEVDEVLLNNLFNEAINSYMGIMVRQEMTGWNEIGLFDKEEVNRGKDKVERYKYLHHLGKSREEIFANLENYIWNDMFATINIIQLTTTDLAYYSGMEDFQKRFAQTHSPAMRLNLSAKDKDGNLYSRDGIERTIYLKDYEVKSDIIANVNKVFTDKINTITNPVQKTEMTLVKDIIVSSFNKINVTDAQGYSSPTSYRKKLGMMGKWDNIMEEAYNRLVSGDMNISDLGILWQPLKPFVYSQVRKSSGVETMSELKVPIQNKNSEYLLILADAITRSGNLPNKLSAIYNFMEDSAYTGRVRDTKGNIINKGTYNGIGIDTIQFESAVKVGKMGVLDINNIDNESDIINYLKESTYDPTDVNDPYNDQNVHSISYEDYGIQQEVPAHLTDHKQLMGSQMRILSISDITSGTTFNINGETLSDVQLNEKYQNLIADNIKESFDTLINSFKLKGNRVDKNKAISKLLTEAIEKDQRYGADMLRACSLNNDGEFNVPLNDPIQSTRIQQLLNSIIKSRINKQKISGGPVVQTSAYGLSDLVHIRWNDRNGNLLMTQEEFKASDSKGTYESYINNNQNSLAYFEAYLPIPSSEIETLLTKEDGSLMSLDEAINNKVLPESIRKAVGYRIPTEDKYSMAPIYIKGFVPKSAGEVIILPQEITLLSGSDFDIDKIYVMLQEYRTKESTNWKQLKRDIANNMPFKGEARKNALESLGIAVDMIKNGNIAFSEGSFEMSVYDYFNDNKSRYISTNFERIEGDNLAGRNNELFDIQWSVLTHPDTMSKMFNPGSFDVQKRTARIINLAKMTDKYSYNDLNTKSLSELNDNLTEVQGNKNKNILFSSTQVYFHKQNMTAGKLIGVFANNNTSHAFVSMQNISVNIENPFTFNGITVNNNSNNKLDDLYAKDGTLISKNIAGYLAASVDAVKDPVLNFMNLNTFTAGTSMMLARLGFDSDSIGLFLTQPVIESVTRDYFKRNNEGYIGIEDIINERIENLSKELGVNPSNILTGLVNNDFNKEDMFNQIKQGTIDNQYQLETLILFGELASLAKDLNTLTFLTKFNSVTNAVGPTIADTLVMRNRYEKFRDKMEMNPPFSESASYVIDNSPILKAFYDTTISDFGASRRIFEEYFPHYSETFTSVLERLRTTTKAGLDSKTINSLVSDFILYKLTIGPDPILDGSSTNRNYYIHNFINEFKEQSSDILDNDLIRIINVESRNNRVPVPTLNAKTGGYSSDSQEKIKNAWSNLMSNESTRDLGMKLFYYNMFRNGFNFSPKTFMHLASVDVKEQIDGYIEGLRDVTFNDDYLNVDSFLDQFRRNHSGSFKLVPRLNEDNRVKFSVDNLGDGSKLATFTYQDKNNISSIIISDTKSGTVYAPIIMYNDKLYRFNSEGTKSVNYIETSVLGNTNNFLEYDGNTGTEITSILLQKPSLEVQEFNDMEKVSDNTPDEGYNFELLNDEEQSFIMEKVFTSEELLGISEMSENNFGKRISDLLDSKITDNSIRKSVRDRLEKLIKKMC